MWQGRAQCQCRCGSGASPFLPQSAGAVLTAGIDELRRRPTPACLPAKRSVPCRAWYARLRSTAWRRCSSCGTVFETSGGCVRSSSTLKVSDSGQGSRRDSVPVALRLGLGTMRSTWRSATRRIDDPKRVSGWLMIGQHWNTGTMVTVWRGLLCVLCRHARAWRQQRI